MANTFNAITTGTGGIATTGDSSGAFAFQKDGVTVATISDTGVVSGTGATPVSSGGTGTTSLTANNVLLGNGTSAVQTVAPGTNGNVLTSNGTAWVSQALPSSAPTTAQVLSATAGASAGDIGTYAFLGQTSLTTTTYSVGSNYTGLGFGAARSTVLANGSLVNQSTLSAASGTWKCMGNDGNVGSATRLTVFLRIA